MSGPPGCRPSVLSPRRRTPAGRCGGPCTYRRKAAGRYYVSRRVRAINCGKVDWAAAALVHVVRTRPRARRVRPTYIFFFYKNERADNCGASDRANPRRCPNSSGHPALPRCWPCRPGTPSWPAPRPSGWRCWCARPRCRRGTTRGRPPRGSLPTA